jgi:ectoine hydroxylase-related dioxygenase (phytanoyl-CoA dioxygenase family)
MSVTPEGPCIRDREIEAYRQQGYLSLSVLTTPAEVAQIKSTLEELFRTRRGENEGAYTDLIENADHLDAITAPQILNPTNYAPSLRKTKCFQNARAIAKQLLGDQAFCFFDHAILKKPEVGVATPWHQDEAFRDPRFEYSELSFWVPLQDVHRDNGCMQFIPGSHRAGILRHDSPNHNRASTALECVDSFDKAAAVACPLPAGGCTIHHPRTVHGTGPNLSDSPRLAYIMVFCLPPKLTKNARSSVWLEQKDTVALARKRRWMWRGGLLISMWRRVRRGEAATPIYILKRSARILRKGT